MSDGQLFRACVFLCCPVFVKVAWLNRHAGELRHLVHKPSLSMGTLNYACPSRLATGGLHCMSKLRLKNAVRVCAVVLTPSLAFKEILGI